MPASKRASKQGSMPACQHASMPAIKQASKQARHKQESACKCVNKEPSSTHCQKYVSSIWLRFWSDSWLDKCRPRTTLENRLQALTDTTTSTELFSKPMWFNKWRNTLNFGFPIVYETNLYKYEWVVCICSEKTFQTRIANCTQCQFIEQIDISLQMLFLLTLLLLFWMSWLWLWYTHIHIYIYVIYT